MAPPDPSRTRRADPKAAIRELIRGREVATRLGALLRTSSSGEGGRDEAGELAEEVLTSVSKALFALDSGEASEVCQGAAAAAGPSSICTDDGRSVAPNGKRKARAAGDCRGGQRRRSQSQYWKVKSKTLDDGHTWRKYGQKGIQSAAHPRSYFRCTHKYDQDCQAIRQVQKSEDDESTFVITYIGHHTCSKGAKSAQPGEGRDSGASFLITFGSLEALPVDGSAGREAPVPAAGLASPPTHECCVDDDDVLSNLSGNDSSPEFFNLPELTAIDTRSVLLPGVSAGTASEIGDATSGLQSSCVSPMSMDLGVESFDFEDMLNLDNHEEFDFRFNRGW